MTSGNSVIGNTVYKMFAAIFALLTKMFDNRSVSVAMLSVRSRFDIAMKTVRTHSYHKQS